MLGHDKGIIKSEPKSLDNHLDELLERDTLLLTFSMYGLDVFNPESLLFVLAHEHKYRHSSKFAILLNDELSDAKLFDAKRSYISDITRPVDNEARRRFKIEVDGELISLDEYFKRNNFKVPDYNYLRGRIENNILKFSWMKNEHIKKTIEMSNLFHMVASVIAKEYRKSGFFYPYHIGRQQYDAIVTSDFLGSGLPLFGVSFHDAYESFYNLYRFLFHGISKGESSGENLLEVNEFGDKKKYMGNDKKFERMKKKAEESFITERYAKFYEINLRELLNDVVMPYLEVISLEDEFKEEIKRHIDRMDCSIKDIASGFGLDVDITLELLDSLGKRVFYDHGHFYQENLIDTIKRQHEITKKYLMGHGPDVLFAKIAKAHDKLDNILTLYEALHENNMRMVTNRLVKNGFDLGRTLDILKMKGKSNYHTALQTLNFVDYLEGVHLNERLRIKNKTISKYYSRKMLDEFPISDYGLSTSILGVFGIDISKAPIIYNIDKSFIEEAFNEGVGKYHKQAYNVLAWQRVNKWKKEMNS